MWVTMTGDKLSMTFGTYCRTRTMRWWWWLPSRSQTLSMTLFWHRTSRKKTRKCLVKKNKRKRARSYKRNNVDGSHKALGSHENSLAKTANGSHTSGRNSSIMRDNRRWSYYLIKRTLEFYMSYNTEKDYYIHKFAKNLIAPAGWSHHDDG